MSDALEQNGSDLNEIRLLIGRQQYEQARDGLKRRLAGDPDDAEAIDLLLRLEREAFAQREARRRAEENPGRSSWGANWLAVSTGDNLWLLALVGGFFLIDVFVGISEWRERRRRKSEK